MVKVGGNAEDHYLSCVRYQCFSNFRQLRNDVSRSVQRLNLYWPFRKVQQTNEEKAEQDTSLDCETIYAKLLLSYILTFWLQNSYPIFSRLIWFLSNCCLVRVVKVQNHKLGKKLQKWTWTALDTPEYFSLNENKTMKR